MGWLHVVGSLKLKVSFIYNFAPIQAMSIQIYICFNIWLLAVVTWYVLSVTLFTQVYMSNFSKLTFEDIGWLRLVGSFKL